jgi:hypothetical protein
MAAGRLGGEARGSVAERVAAATAELDLAPELTAIKPLMDLPPLTVPALVLVDELVPPGDLSVVARSFAVAANELVEDEDE